MSENTETEPVKTISTDASNIIVDTIEKTLIDIIKNSLDSPKLLKTDINLTPEVTNIIKKLLSITPDTFSDIEKSANQIIKDNKIDSSDIPQLIILVQRIYQFIHSLKDSKLDTNKRSEYTATILKFIIQLLVLHGKIKIEEDKQIEFLKNVGILIDSCVGLLSFPKSLKTKGCIKKIFG